MKPTTMVLGPGNEEGSRWVWGTRWAPTPSNCCLLCPSTGTLTKFTLVLYGTAPEGLPTPPESIGCKTLTSGQACVGQSWVLWGSGDLGLGYGGGLS